jgi:hypothetical protein
LCSNSICSCQHVAIVTRSLRSAFALSCLRQDKAVLQQSIYRCPRIAIERDKHRRMPLTTVTGPSQRLLENRQHLPLLALRDRVRLARLSRVSLAIRAGTSKRLHEEGSAALQIHHYQRVAPARGKRVAYRSRSALGLHSTLHGEATAYWRRTAAASATAGASRSH